MEAVQTPESANIAFCAAALYTPDDVSTWLGDWWLIAADPDKPLQRCINTIEGFEVPCYCPREKVRVIHGGQRRIVMRPLFDRYVFACVPGESYLPDQRRHWFAKTIQRISDQPRIRRELASVQTALGVDPFLSSCKEIMPGATVRIVKGGMRGLEGRVQRYDGGYWFYLDVSIMGRSVQMQVTEDKIELI